MDKHGVPLSGGFNLWNSDGGYRQMFMAEIKGMAIQGVVTGNIISVVLVLVPTLGIHTSSYY